MSDEELIEKAAKAIWEESTDPGRKRCWEDESEYVADEYAIQARAALAVFREHTAPTGDDREALKQVISDSVGGWNKNTQAITRTTDAIMSAGFRRVAMTRGTDQPNRSDS